MLKRLLFIPVVLFSFAALAQTGSISGAVKDTDSGEVLIGATVIVKGTSKGTIADLEGNFLIKNVPSGNQTIQVSFVGYETIEIAANIIDAQDNAVGDISLESSTIGLEAIEIFASVVEDRKTPVAVSSISAQQLSERHEGVALADVIANTPGVYTTQGAGGYGDQEVYIRGFDQSNVAFLVNGIPVNDMENGRMFWSNFSGLNEVTRSLQVQRGLGASKLAISSIGGTVNMITKPTEKKEGGKIEYQTGTGSWNQRMRFTYNTGQLDGGWAVSFQGVRTTTNSGLLGLQATKQGSIVPGAFVDSWSYYLAVSKTINDKHQLIFWGLGAPVNRGSAFIADDTTRKRFGITDPVSNTALGVYQGDLINVRQNKVNKPLMSLSHYWDIDDNTSLNTSVYFSHAKVYSTQPVDAKESTFIPSRTDDQNNAANIEGIDANLATVSGGLVNWDYFSGINTSSAELELTNVGGLNSEVVTGRASRFFLESRHNNHDWIGLISNFRKDIGQLEILAGVDLRHYRGEHYAEVQDLFGGDFVLNETRFQNDYNKLKPHGIARVGDRYRYDYVGYVDWVAGFGQAEYTIDNITLFATATVTNTWYKRVGNFWNGQLVYNDHSFGQSDTKSFLSYTTKAGVSYSPTNRHKVFANGGYYTRPPFFRNVFADSRYSNEYRPNLETEKILSGEMGYSYRTSKIKANVNAYYTSWNDRTTTFDANSFNTELGNVEVGDEIPITFDGIRSIHKGVEVDFTYNITSNLELSGQLSLGDWKWDNNATTIVSFTDESNLTTIDTITVNLKGFRVGTTAQTTGGLSIHYRGIKDMYIGARWNYADRIAVRFSPEDVANGYITIEDINNTFDNYSTFSLYAGRYFDVGENMRGRLSFSMQNVFDTQYVRWASFFFNQFQRGFGYPRTYTVGLSVEF